MYMNYILYVHHFFFYIFFWLLLYSTINVIEWDFSKTPYVKYTKIKALSLDVFTWFYVHVC